MNANGFDMGPIMKEYQTHTAKIKEIDEKRKRIRRNVKIGRAVALGLTFVAGVLEGNQAKR